MGRLVVEFVQGVRCFRGLAGLPRTCCSSCIITSTAIFKMPNLVCGLSVLRCCMHIRPSSLSASLMSRIRILRGEREKKKYGLVTSDTLLQLGNDFHCLVQDCELGFDFVIFQMGHAHSAQFLECLIYVFDANPGTKFGVGFARFPATGSFSFIFSIL
jgi:hypothetical protein